MLKRRPGYPGPPADVPRLSELHSSGVIVDKTETVALMAAAIYSSIPAVQGLQSRSRLAAAASSPPFPVPPRGRAAPPAEPPPRRTGGSSRSGLERTSTPVSPFLVFFGASY